MSYELQGACTADGLADWKARNRTANIECMAKAIWLAQARLQLASPDESAWPLVDQGHYRSLAEAAYDAL